MPADAAARAAIAAALDDTVFVEAGAGSGKTSCLVERFVTLVEAGVDADRIAAITFTERAAGELADRIRGELQRRSSPRCSHAIEVLDRAAIGTLHAFAQRLLSEHPIEAELPPRFTVLDEIASQLAFEARWDAFVDRIIEDPELERPLRLLLAAGARLDHLHEVAVQFGANWDLVAERHRPGASPAPVPPLELSALLADVDAVVAMGGRCRADDDRMLARLAELAEWGRELRGATDDDARLVLLEDAPSCAAGRLGQQPNWLGLDEVRSRVEAIGVSKERIRSRALEACLQRLADELAAFTVETAAARRRDGELEFHDLLVLARTVLRDPRHGAAVRAAVARRYQRILLDEFQDTDPIQVELAVLIASKDPDAGSKPWWEVAVEPGHLFFVGDPKQSIYRFRRADISTFLRARDHLGGRIERLTSNFRSAAPILSWVNHAFSRLIIEERESQPAYVPLVAEREAPPKGPCVSFIGATELPKSFRADDLRREEAASVAAAAREAVVGAWSVYDAAAREWRDARWDDVAILLPARTSLPMLERALEAAAVPYRAETSSLVYGTAEVRDLLTIARAVEDPTDSLSVVAALRTAALGCGDDDLYTWHTTFGGWWDHQRPPPEGAPSEHIVARGLRWLGDLHHERVWIAPSQVLERIVRERRMMELAFAHARPRDLWRRLRFVVDQCRAWEEAGGSTLRDYLQWVKLQSAPGSRVIETVLPETDDHAVRILTVHGAKGLEFPITILSGLTTALARRPNGVQVLFPGAARWAVKLKKGLDTEDFKSAIPVEEQMDEHERLRLLYVAATRARDHLVVSVHRKHGAKPDATAAGLLHRAGWDETLVEVLDFGAAEPNPPLATSAVPVTAALPSLAEWESARAAALASGTRRLATSATQLAEAAARARDDVGLRKDPRDIDLPPWQKGRYGTAVGRAVHGVLQTVDLASGAGLADAAAAQAAAEGVLGREGVIASLCRSALASDIVQRAAARQHWREVYVGVPYGDAVLEGYIDLLYRDDDGLVVVDYKTDAWETEADLAGKVERYRVQLDAYALAVETVLDEKVVRSELLFLATTGDAHAVVL